MTQNSPEQPTPERELTTATPADQTPEPETSPAPGPEYAALAEKAAEAQKAADQLKDQLLRKAAEFENYKRRTDGEYANLVRSANENLLLAMLPIIDDFSRSLKSGKEKRDFEVFYRGIELIHSKLTRALEGEGLRAFESEGKPFDVRFHDALLMIPRPDLPPHTVVEEVERGYMLNDRVLRHAKVIVSTEPETLPPDAPDDAEKELDA
jgi:molecular chaperone GrpE